MNLTNNIITELKRRSQPEKAQQMLRFFKTGKGEYGENDKFLGLTSAEIREVAKANKTADFTTLSRLLESEYHEIRMCGGFILVEQFKKARDTASQKIIVDFYLDHLQSFNNWDLVDSTCYNILGNYLLKQDDRSILYELADSGHLWSQRVAMVSTMAFLRKEQFEDTFKLAELLLHHPHDLMHKAVGWLLKEAGKRNRNRLNSFLDQFAKEMPRTMLRIAIEKHPPEVIEKYMQR
ncbi:DNA alkylation repair protein [Saccharicrinis sp. FJH54]|uniref:DNA alkylation repair protein n=1 Tax=Saccharicrinis sp. FJH54 TaxID=3344665 RepID=UPI0035D41DFA